MSMRGYRHKVEMTKLDNSIEKTIIYMTSLELAEYIFKHRKELDSINIKFK